MVSHRLENRYTQHCRKDKTKIKNEAGDGITMKHMKKILALAMCGAMAAVAFTGCSNNGTTTSGTSEGGNTNLSGTITMTGSTSMQNLCQALQEVFPEVYPNVTIDAQFTGSGAGIEAVTAGTVDIGNASRALTDEEKAEGIVENVVAIDGIAVVVNPANDVTNLTQDQLKQIYTGEVTNWSEVGGPDMAIVVVGRESGSGTRSAFEELLGVEDACAYAQELDSTGGVATTVSSTEGAIGYLSLDALDDTVKSIQIDGVDATEENITAGTYALQRPFVMATKGEISEQSELVQAFFEFVYSEQGQEVVSQVGLITVDGPSAE